MIRSMTGFGRSEIYDGERKFTVEIKAVNHRYLDFYIKMPKKFGIFEAAIRNELKKYIHRGKVDIYIGYEDLNEAQFCVKYNQGIAALYMGYLKQISEEFGLDYDIRTSTLSRFPEVFTMEEQDINKEKLWEHLLKALNLAAGQFVEAREKEGANLCADIQEKLNGMLVNIDYISERAPRIIAEYHDRLKEKVKALMEDVTIDEARLFTEVAIFADRTCLDEELVRLKSHIGATSYALKKDASSDSKGDSNGRKLDFLAQEMNREANTIMAKANDLEVTNNAIELKTEIEKIREQIQNIE
ncbi:MAG: YicC family protein [Lachnospiraceae bacterium]|nr:YicC family protein [Lachnospiraceae bacterium]